MEEPHPIWLYDGDCLLCSNNIKYVLRHERDRSIRFVAIQSAKGRALALAHGLDPDNPESFLFIENGNALMKSDGMIAMLRHVGGPARLLRAIRFLPRPVRDWCYDRIARNRYRLFGRTSSCQWPEASQRHRFTLPEPS